MRGTHRIAPPLTPGDRGRDQAVVGGIPRWSVQPGAQSATDCDIGTLGSTARVACGGQLCDREGVGEGRRAARLRLKRRIPAYVDVAQPDVPDVGAVR